MRVLKVWLRVNFLWLLKWSYGVKCIRGTFQRTWMLVVHSLLHACRLSCFWSWRTFKFPYSDIKTFDDVDLCFRPKSSNYAIGNNAVMSHDRHGAIDIPVLQGFSNCMVEILASLWFWSYERPWAQTINKVFAKCVFFQLNSSSFKKDFDNSIAWGLYGYPVKWFILIFWFFSTW